MTGPDLEQTQRLCACGCGQLVTGKTSHGLIRKFAVGHNGRGRGSRITVELAAELVARDIRKQAAQRARYEARRNQREAAAPPAPPYDPIRLCRPCGLFHRASETCEQFALPPA